MDCDARLAFEGKFFREGYFYRGVFGEYPGRICRSEMYGVRRGENFSINAISKLEFIISTHYFVNERCLSIFVFSF